MTTIPILKRFVIFISISIFVLLQPAAARGADQNTEKQAENKLQQMGTILYKSTSAKQVEASENQKAITILNDAREVGKHAEVMFSEKNFQQSLEDANIAIRKLMEAVKLLHSSKNRVVQMKNLFEKRNKQVDIFFTTAERIKSEKGWTEEQEQLFAKAYAERAFAMELYKDNSYDDAIKTLDTAYLLVTASVGSMKQGETLVRTLEFKTPKDEYDYEVDRNEVFFSLIDIYLKGKIDEKTKIDIDKARDIQKKASVIAEKGEYKDAVKELEISTKMLIRLVRTKVGLYIPM